MKDSLSPELQKTSAFGRFFFYLALALFTLGVLAVIGTIGKSLRQFLDACFVGCIFFIPAFVLWLIGFRHDRAKLTYYWEKKIKENGEK